MKKKQPSKKHNPSVYWDFDDKRYQPYNDSAVQQLALH